MQKNYPNKSEIEFLTLSYNRFLDLFDKIMSDDFWELNQHERFSNIKDVFFIYSELLNYEPLKFVLQKLKTTRPPMESEIGGEVFKFVRNVVSHFPFFTYWEEIWISEQLINWNKKGQSIDKFLKKYSGYKEVKYRFWEPKIKKMTYLSIKFPEKYEGEKKIYLNEMISEKEGVKFSIILMKQILFTQIEEIKYEK